MAEWLSRYSHLIRYADLAYRNCDGAEFRALAWELGGNVEGGHSKIEIQLPSFPSRFRFLTVNAHVHLGIRNDDTLVLAFRGTDWPSAAMDFFNPSKCPVLIHEGFLYAFNDLLYGKKLEQSIYHLVKDRPTKIKVCGHSLDAALATLCSAWCRVRWPSADVTCVTLGSPRVGNEALCNLFKDTKSFRVMMDADPVPTVPDRRTQATPLGIPASLKLGTAADRRYRHVGIPIVLQPRYHRAHYGIERHDIKKEEAEHELNWIDKLWLFVYWPIRILEMVVKMRENHASGAYVTAVQRIREKSGSKADGA
ncbi:hypothetical protein VTI74DRAFT_2265 [Chaetomium olivicolor]